MLFFEKDLRQKGGRGAGKRLTPQRWGEGGGEEGKTPGTAKHLEVRRWGGSVKKG